ncbi:glyoxalase superfamily protein [Thermomonas sp. HDW16]|uniref:glyoxalase superfamily protein n=1 Tax=Thermomonas sp. HDW16 TaxID=2714945 RepID=UPI00140DAB3F|nr:glyoxalase superfamily protein [Thermomonas sp. HDW16]QIL21571.1 VOC family protein [Thermomonas sp. HDW16]
MLRALVPMLRVPDVLASVAWYRDVLGFEADFDGSDSSASLQRDGIELMLSAFNAHEGDAAPAFTGSLYLHCDDVDAWWARLQDIARICYPIEDFGYGMREFAIYDCNGFLLQFGQPIPAKDPP